VVTWIAVSGFTALTALAAGRLLAVWRRSHQLPELLIAILILGVGTVAVGLGFLLRAWAPDAALAIFLPIAGADVGMTALAIFSWQVYRPGSALAKGAVVLVALGMLAVLADCVIEGRNVTLESTPASMTSSAIYVGVMAWSALEALLYWRPMRRRQRLGLADPVVTNRVLLWAIATGVASIGILIGAAAQHLGGVDPRESLWVSLVYALHGSVSAVAFWLAFAPPAFYRRWVCARSADPASA
jgi:hypothetical protein